MRMEGVRTSRHIDLSSRKGGNPWYVTLGYSNTVMCLLDIRGDLISRTLWM